MVGHLRFVVVVIYLLIGAGIFTALERTDEPSTVTASRHLKATRFHLSVKFGMNVTDEEFDEVVDKISEALMIRQKRDWTFWRSFDFVVISLTTIGKKPSFYSFSMMSAIVRQYCFCYSYAVYCIVHIYW